MPTGRSPGYSAKPHKGRLGTRPTAVIVALTGPLAAGKTTLAIALAASVESPVAAIRDLLAPTDREQPPRAELQRVGAEREGQTQGRWLAEAIVDAYGPHPSALVIDAVRTPAQAVGLREAFHPRLVIIYLSASQPERRRRFENRDDAADRDETFEDAENHPIEKVAESLIGHSHLAVDTTQLPAAAVLRVAQSYLSGRTEVR